MASVWGKNLPKDTWHNQEEQLKDRRNKERDYGEPLSS